MTKKKASKKTDAVKVPATGKKFEQREHKSEKRESKAERQERLRAGHSI